MCMCMSVCAPDVYPSVFFHQLWWRGDAELVHYLLTARNELDMKKGAVSSPQWWCRWKRFSRVCPSGLIPAIASSLSEAREGVKLNKCTLPLHCTIRQSSPNRIQKAWRENCVAQERFPIFECHQFLTPDAFVSEHKKTEWNKGSNVIVIEKGLLFFMFSEMSKGWIFCFLTAFFSFHQNSILHSLPGFLWLFCQFYETCDTGELA